MNSKESFISALYHEETDRIPIDFGGHHASGIAAIHLENLEKWMSAVGPCIDIVLFGDDLGGQPGPLMGPETCRLHYKPYHNKMWNRAKELADVKVQLHCNEGIYELLPDMIEAGLDAVNPVQISCKGMDPQRLKNEFGDQLNFRRGGCDTQQILPRGEVNPA
jgi:uroporphyrinogen decarboxylase